MSTPVAATWCVSQALDASAPPELRYYRDALQRLNAAQAPYLVGGAYAFALYTGIQRHTKDCDIFVRARDCERVLAVLADAGYRTEVTFTHWLGKAFSGDHLIDVIFGSGNGLCAVDDAWFTHAPAAELLGVPVRLTPAEEMIWSKAFIMERERFDGADINHVLRACGASLDWERLIARFGTHWPVLLTHLVLFRYSYPADLDPIPRRVLTMLLERAATDIAAGDERVCRGTLLSRQYVHDVRRWGYRDARVRPLGGMTADEVARWMAAFPPE
jgi:hypothetical protein